RVLLGLRERLFTAKANLATTAALEHFTAIFAEVALTQEDDRRAHPVIADLFIWHALEETEHKAVAFDVYRAVGGSERTRIWTMRLVRIGFATALVLQTAVSLLGDRETYRRGVLRASLRRFRDSPLLGRMVKERLDDYDRPGFHPDDHDTDELLAEWREALFGETGRLNHRLVTTEAA
ncbi:MAG: metal-dependent hydrolase, partial [Actinomycetota bacterium]